MTSADTEAMTALQELLDERQRYEGWIVALEQRKSSTTAHVYSRVHTDYTLRLERVLHRLSERTEQLQSTVQLLTSRLAALRNRETDRIDARQEAELRAIVGEYTDEEWATMRDDADREISSIAEERSGVETELAEIERIVEMTRTSQLSSSEAPAIATLVTAESEEALKEGGEAPSSGEPPQSIQDFLAEQPAHPSDPPSQTSARSEAEAKKSDLPQAAVSLGTATPPAQSETHASPIVEPKRENEKTLKCPECGGLNYATEWYCERCGGELRDLLKALTTLPWQPYGRSCS